MEISQGYCISEICLHCAGWNETVQTMLSVGAIAVTALLRALGRFQMVTS